MTGHDGDPEATAAAIGADGLLHSGDLAVMRPDGCVRITGRLRDRILRGGEDIDPCEIEEFLCVHPKIAEGGGGHARFAPRRGRASTDPAEAGQNGHGGGNPGILRGKIASFKIPEHIRFVDSFPMTASGKVQKFRIREQEIRERGREAAARTAKA
jgi:fatty-acyl-CoA synthase